MAIALPPLSLLLNEGVNRKTIRYCQLYAGDFQYGPFFISAFLCFSVFYIPTERRSCMPTGPLLESHIPRDATQSPCGGRGRSVSGLPSLSARKEQRDARAKRLHVRTFRLFAFITDRFYTDATILHDRKRAHSLQSLWGTYLCESVLNSRCLFRFFESRLKGGIRKAGCPDAVCRDAQHSVHTYNI